MTKSQFINKWFNQLPSDLSEDSEKYLRLEMFNDLSEIVEDATSKDCNCCYMTTGEHSVTCPQNKL